MSVEFWRNAEQFYEFWFFVISILVLVSVIAMIFIASYTTKENRKKYILVMIGVPAILITIGLFGHTRYQPYLEQAMYVNPLIRDRQPRLLTYIPYSTSEQTHYEQLNDLDSLRKMVLYEEEQVTEPVTYLGQGDHFHYFERSNGHLFKENRRIEFTETTQQAQLVGSQFTLIDDSFQELGFKNPENNMFKSIEIPVSEQEKTYQPEDDTQIQKAADRISQWNF